MKYADTWTSKQSNNLSLHTLNYSEQKPVVMAVECLVKYRSWRDLYFKEKLTLHIVF